MADAGTDATTTVEYLKKAADALGGDVKTKLEAFWKTLKDSTVNVSDAAKAAGISAAELGDKIQETGGKIALATVAANAYSDALQKVTGIANNIPDLLGKLENKLDTMGTSAASNGVKIVLAVEPFLNIIPDTIRKTGEVESAVARMGNNTASTFEAMTPKLQAALQKSLSVFGDKTGNELGQMAVTGFTRTLQSFDRGTAIEKQLIGMAAATGTLNNMFIAGTDNLQNMDVELSTHIGHMGSLAQATGLSVTEVMKAADVFGKTFPDALSTTIQLANKDRTAMSELEATIKTASYYQIEHKNVMGQVQDMYRSFNSTGTATMERLTDMYRVAQELKLPAEEVSKKIIDMARAFSLLGDNTRAATNVLDGLKKAMKSSDLSPEGMMKIYESMMSGISKLDMGKKAFISSQTGGPGGMAGGLQMERLISEGKTDEVLRKTMQSMQQQFGGPTLTLKQATDNPALAGEFVKQREYLKQVAGVAGSDEEANRILEAMQNGMLDQIQLGESQNSGQKELLKATERGTKVLELSNTLLSGVQRATEITALTQTANATKEVRSVIGMGEGGEKTPFGEQLKLAMMTGTGEGARTGSVGVQGPGKDNLYLRTSEALNNDLMRDAIEQAKNLKNLGKVMFGKISETVAGLGSMSEDANFKAMIPRIVQKIERGLETGLGLRTSSVAAPPPLATTAPRMAGPTPIPAGAAAAASVKQMKMDGDVKITVDFQNADKLSPEALKQVADVVKDGFEKYVKESGQRRANV